MSSMPKDHISLPPKPEAPRPADHPFHVPAPSVSINENVFRNPDNDQSLVDVQVAIAGLRRAAETVQRGAVAIHQNEMKTEPARHAEAAEYAYKVTRPALMSSDAAVQRLAAEIAALKAKTTTPPPVRDTLASEIRAAIARMPQAERTKAVLASIKSGSDDIVSACLGGPALLSGMSETQHAHVRASYAALRHPDTVKRIESLEKGMEHLERAGKLALKYSLEVADRSIVDRAKASAQRAAEAVAEANRPLLN